MSLPAVLFDFEGEWLLSRLIRDTRAGQHVQADGIAVLRRDGDGLVYDETITLRIPGQAEMTGTRRYLWRDAGDHIAIHFEDGRYFHALRLGQASARDHHDCPPDSYDAVYEFSGWPIWTVRWAVAGPRKSYQMETRYALK